MIRYTLNIKNYWLNIDLWFWNKHLSNEQSQWSVYHRTRIFAYYQTILTAFAASVSSYPVSTARLTYHTDAV